MRKVLIPTKLDKFAADMLRENGYEVVLDGVTPMNELIKSHPDTRALIVRSENVTPEIIDALPQLELVVRAGAGYNTIDIKYARQKGVDVMNTPGANANGVAEEVVTMILAAYRHVVPADISTRKGDWEKSKFLGRELTGKTIGIIGVGNIGQLLVKRLAGFENEILGYDPVLSPALAEKLGVELTTVQDIFSRADIVSLHIPETPETKGMVNKSLLDLMKDGAMLVNCARSGVINEADLRVAKATKKLIFCNDVYPKDEAGAKTVADIADLMLPHLGANTKEANLNAARQSAEQIIAYYSQGITFAVVNKSVPDGMNKGYQSLANVLAKVAYAYLGKQENPHRVETSFYGNLAQFAKWLIAPVTAALATDFDLNQGIADAEKYLKENGVEFVNREVDDNKNYGDSMTIDLFVGHNPIRKASLRGTMVENKMMITRLNDYDNLYLNPEGNHLFVEYADSPGVIAKIAGVLGEANANIIDIRAPQNLKTGNAITVVQTNIPLNPSEMEKIRQSVKATNVFQISF